MPDSTILHLRGKIEIVNLKFFIPAAAVLIILSFFVKSEPPAAKIKTAGVVPLDSVCIKGQGPRRFDPDIASLSKRVSGILSEGKIEKIIFWASCDFEVSLRNSDLDDIYLPEEFFMKLAKFFSAEKWMDAPAPEETRAVLSSRDGKYELIFRKHETKGWFWSGVVTSEPTLLSK